MLAEIKALLVEWCGLDERVQYDTPLRLEGGMDSVGFAQAVQALEDRYGIEITDAEMMEPANLRTIEGMAALVERKQ